MDRYEFVSMKALVCEQFGLPENLSMKTLPLPVPNGQQVLIEVHACGVNFPDALIIQNKYQFKPQLPFAPGGEVAGRVVEVGSEVKHLSQGDLVFALTGWGGMAEYVVAESHKCMPVPEGMDMITAATTMYNFGTSLYALKQRAQLKKGEKLLVLGASGGVGLAAVQIGKQMGAHVVAAASSEEKLEICLQAGADETLNYSEQNLKEKAKAMTNGDGFDVIYDPVGDQYAEPAVRSLAWGGRYLVVGFAAGAPSAIRMNLPLLKGASIVGVFWGAFAQKQPKESKRNFEQILQWIQEGKVKQHIHKEYPLERGAQAIRDLMDRKVIGKNVVIID
ncbi:NADPH:quinone oxidoreductase [Roseivirga thermotolerans]|uniref:NADPH:quinone oxidoreductase n=2 Tax=Roseivirga thermotolerans TaxID=1758176 RepID=A0ABQ3I887_9BACT|nr:NADPH:quinone oxidoreductase [Roseivirga thermotolerans]